MWRLIRFLFTGDGHLHKWKFTHVDSLNPKGRANISVAVYVKVCETCGSHKSGRIQDCWADSAEELNP
jgi:hypothetical protein